MALFGIIVLAHDLQTVTGVLFLYGIFTAMRLTVGFVYLTELLPKASHTLVITVWCILNGLFAMIATLYLEHRYSFENFVYIGLYLQATSLIGSCLLPESPKLLLDLGRFKETKEHLKYIARCNRKQETFRPDDLVTPRSNADEGGLTKGSRCQTGRHKEIAKSLVKIYLSLMASVWLATCFVAVDFPKKFMFNQAAAEVVNILGFLTGGFTFYFLGV